MSNNQLPADVQERIKLDAEDYANKHMNGRVNTHEFSIVAAGYIAGAMTENASTQSIIDAFEELLIMMPKGDGLRYYHAKEQVIKGRKLLQQWKEGNLADN